MTFPQSATKKQQSATIFKPSCYMRYFPQGPFPLCSAVAQHRVSKRRRHRDSDVVVLVDNIMEKLYNDTLYLEYSCVELWVYFSTECWWHWKCILSRRIEKKCAGKFIRGWPIPGKQCSGDKCLLWHPEWASHWHEGDIYGLSNMYIFCSSSTFAL